MIGFVLAIAATASVTAGPSSAVRGNSACAVLNACPRSADDGDRDMRLTQSAGPSYDMKMDAYRLNSRPCRLIGNLRCPGKLRTIWRMGEPVQQTLAHSFGLD